MEWFRQHPRASVAALVVAALAVVAATVVLLLPGDDAPDVALPPAPTARPSATAPDPVARKTAEESDGTSRRNGGPRTMTFGGFPGLGGSGYTLNTPRRKVTLSVSSSSRIGTVGYIVPTSRTDSYGTAKNVGTSWSLTTGAYGPPDYAQVFVQAGPSGDPVTCTITVDGKVTERRSTSGPYGQLLCQG